MNGNLFYCGEVVADFLEAVPKSGVFELTLGGSSFFSALGARQVVESERLTANVSFVGPLSNDTFGLRFETALREAGVQIHGVRAVERNTTLAVVSIRPGKENAFSFYTRNTVTDMTSWDELPLTLPGERKICCFGSISTVLEPARFAWWNFASAQSKTSLIYYDLNTRPSVATSPDDYRKIVSGWAAAADIVKASDADIAWTYPGLSTRDVADIWLGQGTLLAVFTKGGEGSEAYTRDSHAFVSAPPLTTASTVGAGDNFNSGFTVNLATTECYDRDTLAGFSVEQIERALFSGNQAAARHLMSLGATPK